MIILFFLAHKNLKYVICHGGVNTLNELLHFGVAILGLPLQGDQPSNLNRIVELGLGQMIGINEIWNGKFGTKILNMETNFANYQKRAKLISSMVQFHRKLSPNQQNFWLHWAKKYGKRLKTQKSGNKLFNFFYRWTTDHFAVYDIIFYGILLTGILWILT